MQTYKLDLRGLVDYLGGPAECGRRLVAMGVPIRPRTVNQWLRREREGAGVDSSYVVNLLAHRALHEGPMDLNQFIVRVDDPNGPRLVRRPHLAEG